MVNTRPNLTELQFAFGCWGGAAPDAAAPRPVTSEAQEPSASEGPAEARERKRKPNTRTSRKCVHKPHQNNSTPQLPVTVLHYAMIMYLACARKAQVALASNPRALALPRREPLRRGGQRPCALPGRSARR